MKVVAFLTEYAVVERIIEHLQLTFVAEKPPPALRKSFCECLLPRGEKVEDFVPVGIGHGCGI
jgi:hypothetical protein